MVSAYVVPFPGSGELTRFLARLARASMKVSAMGTWFPRRLCWFLPFPRGIPGTFCMARK
jgi:hypothetical protein